MVSASSDPQPTPAITREILRIRDIPDPRRRVAEFRSVRAEAKRIGDKVGEAYSQFELAHSLFRFDPAKSVQEYLEAEKLLESVELPLLQAAALANAAGVLRDAGENAQAIGLLQKSVRIAQRMGDPATIAYATNSLGLSYNIEGTFTKAIEMFETAVSLFRQVRNSEELSNSLTNLGFALSNSGQKSKAMQVYGEALTIRRSLPRSVSLVILLTNMGATLRELGSLDDSLVRLNEALSVSRLLGIPVRSSTLNNLGGVYELKNLPVMALDFYRRGFETAKMSGDVNGMAFATNNLGAMHYRLGDLETAAARFQEASSLWLSAGNQKDRALALANIGSVKLRSGSASEALELYNQSLKIFQQTQNRPLEADVLGDIGRVCYQLGLFREAATAVEASLQIKMTLQSREDLAISYQQLSAIYLKLGDEDASLKALLTALTYDDQQTSDFTRAILYDSLAFLFERQSKDLAIALGKHNIEIRQSQRAAFGTLSPQLQRTFQESLYRQYKAIADLLIQRGRFVEAEEILTLYRSAEAQFYDSQLRSSETSDNKRLFFTSGETRFITDFQAFLKRLSSLSSREGSSRPIGRGMTAEDTANLLKEWQTFLESAKRKAAATQSKLPEEQTLRSRKVLDALREGTKGESALAQYVVTDEGITVLLSTRKGTSSSTFLFQNDGKAIGVGSLQDFNQLVFDFRKALINRNSNPLPLAKKLYDILLKKSEGKVIREKVNLLLVSPDGALRNIPFAALSPDGKAWLGHQMDIANYSDQTVIRWKGREKMEATFFGVTKPATVDFLARRYSFSPLPNVAREAELAQKIGTVASSLDRDFTKARLLTAIAKPSKPILHIASHFERGLRADTSFLLLGDGSTISQRELIENPATDLSTLDLLILSACDTATEQPPSLLDEQGRAAESFAEGLLREGANSILASLWKVNDQATADLMGAFYNHYSQGKSKAEALRIAMRETAGLTSNFPSGLIRSGTLEESSTDNKGFPGKSHPFFWAPFTLYGSPL